MSENYELPTPEVRSKSLIRPASPTPHCTLGLSKLDSMRHHRMYVKMVLLFRKAVDCEALKSSLSAVLVPYYPLAGRFVENPENKGELVVDCNDDGVLFVDAFMDVTVDELLMVESELSASWRKLLPEEELEKPILSNPPTIIQVTYLRCGGMILCHAGNHCFHDGTGVGQFFVAWAQLCCHPTSPHPTVQPSWGRESLKPKGRSKTRTHSPETAEYQTDPEPYPCGGEPLVPVFVTIEANMLRQLKNQCLPYKTHCTSFEALTAHVWRCFVRAMQEYMTTSWTWIAFPVNMRSRIDPPLPDGYYGNAVVYGAAQIPLVEMVEQKLSRAIVAMQEAKALLLSEGYLQWFLEEAESHAPPRWGHLFSILQRKNLVEGLVLNFQDESCADLGSPGNFADMPNLRLLHINNVRFHGVFEQLPANLKWLEWHHCTLDTLPLNLTQLIILELTHSENLVMKNTNQLSPNRVLDKLQVLDLTGCRSLEEAEFSVVSNLRKLVLDECRNLVNIDKSVKNLKGLEVLSLKNCKKLKELPEEIGSIPLQTLDLSHCSGLSNLPYAVWDMRSLKVLLLCESVIKEIPDSVKNLKKLEYLSLSGCKSLQSLPVSIGGLTALKKLVLDGTPINCIPHSIRSLTLLHVLSASWCRKLTSLPDSIGCLSGLQVLSIDGINIRSLPYSIGMLENLKVLTMSQCKALHFLPTTMGNMKCLKELDIRATNILNLPDGFENLSSLQVLRMTSCECITQLPENIGELRMLRSLDLRNCSKLALLPLNFSELSSLGTLRMDYSKLSRIPSRLENLSQLKELSLNGCQELRHLFRVPSSLISLHACCCTSLEDFPDVSALEYLQDLHLTNCTRLTHIHGLEFLKSLRDLQLAGCSLFGCE